MPLEESKGYGSDSGSCNHSCNSTAEPNSRQENSGSSATFSESKDDRRASQNSTGNLILMNLSSKNPIDSASVQSSSLKLLSQHQSLELVYLTLTLLFQAACECKRGFKRPRTHWDLCSTWTRAHVGQDDIKGEITRIMAIYVGVANIEVTLNRSLKHNTKQCELLDLFLFQSCTTI